jgi:eukaryotic-like serine/threonine-protein kinase
VSVDGHTVLDGRYTLEALVGRGGMADVYRATDQLLRRTVAVKLLRDVSASESDRRRFAAEAQTLAQLNHPGLVTVLDAGSADDRPYLVMELIDGPSLAASSSGVPLSVAQTASIGAQVADALAYVHAAGIVHRDIKPGNILLGAAGQAWLSDFGIARLVEDAARHTATGLIVGTASYLAPEQLRGGDVTAAADVYSLGLVLIEAITGNPAYPGTGIEAAMARLSRQPGVPEQLPADWQRLLRAMTDLEPGSRPTAAAVSTTLRSIEDDPGHTRVLTQAVERPATRGRLVWIGALIAAAALVAIGAVMVVTGTGGGDSRRVEMPTNVPPSLQQPLQDLHDAVNGDGQ